MPIIERQTMVEGLRAMAPRVLEAYLRLADDCIHAIRMLANIRGGLRADVMYLAMLAVVARMTPANTPNAELFDALAELRTWALRADMAVPVSDLNYLAQA